MAGQVLLNRLSNGMMIGDGVQTAVDSINRELSASEQKTLAGIYSLVKRIVIPLWRSGSDLTAGSLFFNFRDANSLSSFRTKINMRIGLAGIGLTPFQVVGPFLNSAPSNDLGRTNIYGIIY